MPDDRKLLLWAVVIFMLNVVAMPVFWYLDIWPDDLPAAEDGPALVDTAKQANRSPGGLHARRRW